MCICVFFFKFFSIMIYYRILNIVGCYCYPSVHNSLHLLIPWGFPGNLVVNNPPASTGNAGDKGWSLGWEEPAGGNGNPLLYSCLENSDSGAWSVVVHGVAKSQTLLSVLSTQSCTNLTLLIHSCSGFLSLGNFKSVLYVSESVA